jgi:hypothetical protein
MSDINTKFAFLLDEFKKNKSTEEVEKLAMAAIEKQVELGDIKEPEEVIEKLAQYRNESVENLVILNKAIEIGKKPDNFEKEASLGSISDNKPANPSSAEEGFFQALIED